jgi:hypothetical protein
MKVFQNFLAGDGDVAVKAKTMVRFLNENVQKLDAANAKLDKRLHRNPAWRAIMDLLARSMPKG